MPLDILAAILAAKKEREMKVKVKEKVKVKVKMKVSFPKVPRP